MRFAYLIMIHNNVEQVKKLLALLDDERNDIYIHIDKKSGISNDAFNGCMHFSHLYCYSKYKVYWADTSQVRCEIDLLKLAIKKKYDYYHLISGSDLPLHNQNYIHHFFENYDGKEFVHFESENFSRKETNNYYHILNPIICRLKAGGKYEGIMNRLINLERYLVNMQKHLGIRRSTFYCGANWFSITDALAREVVKYRCRINRKIFWTISADEIFLQSFMVEKGYDKNCYRAEKDNNYSAIMRDIDWGRGTPYVWRKENYEELVSSPFLFARKFDQSVDKEIVDLIIGKVTRE